MSATRPITLLSRRAVIGIACPLKPSSSRHLRYFGTGLPDSIKRVGQSAAFPNEYPGQNYDFNWALNFDGVTPLKKSSFRIMKPLDLKIAGLDPLTNTPLKVCTLSEKGLIPEAGSDSLSFEAFDDVAQKTKDLLSNSDTLYCPEGHIPSTRTGVRIITNSSELAPKLSAYLERMPKRDPSAQPITAYVLEGDAGMTSEEDFRGYAIEEVEDVASGEVKSVASVVVVGKGLKVETVVAGLELSVGGLLEDEEARKKEAEEAAAAAEEG
mmetsp:Transcript_33596/g.40263  ORF Transcript_33596/g.40263 Transcript_33596/m.40263 type:complete len:268 (+) Transcript_33596:40-843(+)|eukprot:CAMPEP_0198249000 /NCGR_PEP_ID=MMETSP1447-20131203/636_1 /TAXON_ID=420782 /ORGANISM="Chaetoceros dichaeta, Strain CCMP1751" /LENGTH=267 /DNA_ID=CAMNT_0043933523 /DNA_START=37 /DNA_END=840 /DNA_ORIENTATION=+